MVRALLSLLFLLSLHVEAKSICHYYDSFVQQGVPEKPLRQALLYYKKNKRKIKNRRFISIADYSQRSSQKRFYLLDMRTAKAEFYKVSHGSGKARGTSYGDPEHDGELNRCKFSTEEMQRLNVHERQNMTRPGFFTTAEFYLSTGRNSSHLERRDNSGRLISGWPNISSKPRVNALRLDGLNSGINDLARSQGVVMHGAAYNYFDIMGRSFGCPAFHPDHAPIILKKIGKGTLFYSYAPICEDDHKKILRGIPGHEEFCD